MAIHAVGAGSHALFPMLFLDSVRPVLVAGEAGVSLEAFGVTRPAGVGVVSAVIAWEGVSLLKVRTGPGVGGVTTCARGAKLARMDGGLAVARATLQGRARVDTVGVARLAG